jgi:hypothetical protein
MKNILLLILLLCSNAFAALTDIKFGRYQIADSQWNVSACLNTNTCQIYSKNPGVMYRIPWTNGQWSWQVGQYVQFSLTGNSSYPYEGKVYNSNGVQAGTIGTGKIVNMGADYFFFVGNDNNTGQLFSGSSGMRNSSGVSWTGTRNPTIAQADTYADASYSTVPLSSGQAATQTPSSGGGGGGSQAPTWPATSDITLSQTNQRNSARSLVANINLGNSVYLETRAGSSTNQITVEQTGNYNKIAGLGGTTYALVNGISNNLNIKQGDILGRNLIEFSVVGNSNTLNITQARSTVTGLQDASESGGHYLGIDITGSSNVLTVKQANDGGSLSSHFAWISIAGNSNQTTLTQMSNGEKTFFGVVSGSSNTVDITQRDSGAKYFDLSLTGGGHSVTAIQKDGGAHRATVNLTNSGGSSTVNLVQQGTTAQNANITQQCATLSGCSVTLTQGQ